MDWKYVQKPGLHMACTERGLPARGTRDEMIPILRDYDDRKKRETTAVRPANRNSNQQSTPRKAAKPAGNLNVSQLTEAELEAICYAHSVPFREDPYGHERRDTINAKFTTKSREAYNKRDDLMDRAKGDCKAIVGRFAADRNEKLRELEAEVSAWEQNQREWGPAFEELKVSSRLLSGYRTLF